MFCYKCGKQLPNDALFCSACGAKQTTQDAYTHAEPQYREEPRYREPPRDQAAPRYAQPEFCDAYGNPIGMKWYKFVIYFQLFASAFAGLGSAGLCFSGSMYDGMAGWVYSVYGGLQVLDIVYGVLCLLLAAEAIRVRMQLAQFSAKGPGSYLRFLVLVGASDLLYIAGMMIIVGSNLAIDGMMSMVISSIITMVIMAVCSSSYFDKRRHLFTR